MEAADINSSPRVSVIVPAYMTSHLIVGALDSVMEQTFRDFEILVVNDGSPDTTELEKVLAPYSEKIVYIKQENKRAAGARNTAIRKAKAEFLAFLDSDDTWLPDHLASQMTLFEQDPALELVYSDGLLVAPEWSRNFMDVCPSHGHPSFEALVVERCQIPVSTVVARKRALVRAGLFDESLARCDDYDMWLRTAFWGAKIGYSKNMGARLSANRPGSLGASRIKMSEAYWEIMQKALQTLPLNESQMGRVRQRTAEARAHHLLEVGKNHFHEGRLTEAVESLSESNTQLPNAKLTLVLLGLKIAPAATRKLVSFAESIRDGTKS
jgi:glycosyltransferase involved in cell wall biosynthesis